MDEDTIADLKQFIASTVSQQTTALGDRLDARIDGLEVRLDGLEIRVDGIDKKIDNFISGCGRGIGCK